MYVARFTHDPQDDIERGWSGWFGLDWKSVRDAAEFHGIEVDEQTDEELIEILADDENVDLRFDNRLKVWRVVHHDGLSCFPLEAETADDAIAEAKAAGLEWAGFGYQTMGSVKLIGTVDGVDDLFVFECEDAHPEH